MIDYVPIGLQVLASLGLAFALLGLSSLSGHRSHSSTDLTAYECGVDLFESADKRYTIRFYMVAVLFILFDIEAAFLYPWATAFRRLGMQGFIVMLVFLGVLTVGLVYCWRRGALDWD